MTRISQPSLLVSALLCLGASLACWLLYFSLYWPYRALFNEEGRFVDEATLVVYHEQSGLLVIPALGLLLLAALAGAVWLVRSRNRGVSASS